MGLAPVVGGDCARDGESQARNDNGARRT